MTWGFFYYCSLNFLLFKFNPVLLLTLITPNNSSNLKCSWELSKACSHTPCLYVGTSLVLQQLWFNTIFPCISVLQSVLCFADMLSDKTVPKINYFEINSLRHLDPSVRPTVRAWLRSLLSDGSCSYPWGAPENGLACWGLCPPLGKKLWSGHKTADQPCYTAALLSYGCNSSIFSWEEKSS